MSTEKQKAYAKKYYAANKAKINGKRRSKKDRPRMMSMGGTGGDGKVYDQYGHVLQDNKAMNDNNYLQSKVKEYQDLIRGLNNQIVLLERKLFWLFTFTFMGIVISLFYQFL